MTISYSTAIRNAQMDAITTDAGASALLRIYSGTIPTAIGTALGAQVLLAELVCNATFAPGAASGVLTLNSIANDASADATGTASFFRIYRSNGTTGCVQGSVTATGGDGDMTLATVSLVAGAVVSVTSAVFTRGNP
jgi:hypothetical protein